jgi:hypothetical protein
LHICTEEAESASEETPDAASAEEPSAPTDDLAIGAVGALLLVFLFFLLFYFWNKFNKPSIFVFFNMVRNSIFDNKFGLQNLGDRLKNFWMKLKATFNRICRLLEIWKKYRNRQTEKERPESPAPTDPEMGDVPASHDPDSNETLKPDEPQKKRNTLYPNLSSFFDSIELSPIRRKHSKSRPSTPVPSSSIKRKHSKSRPSTPFPSSTKRKHSKSRPSTPISPPPLSSTASDSTKFCSAIYSPQPPTAPPRTPLSTPWKTIELPSVHFPTPSTPSFKKDASYDENLNPFSNSYDSLNKYLFRIAEEEEDENKKTVLQTDANGQTDTNTKHITPTDTNTKGGNSDTFNDTVPVQIENDIWNLAPEIARYFSNSIISPPQTQPSARRSLNFDSPDLTQTSTPQLPPFNKNYYKLLPTPYLSKSLPDLSISPSAFPSSQVQAVTPPPLPTFFAIDLPLNNSNSSMDTYYTLSQTFGSNTSFQTQPWAWAVRQLNEPVIPLTSSTSVPNFSSLSNNISFLSIPANFKILSRPQSPIRRKRTRDWAISTDNILPKRLRTKKSKPDCC